MHFNLYIDDRTGTQLSSLAKTTGRSRNALIRVAVSEWLERHHPATWPMEVQQFEPDAAFPPFEANRQDLPPISDDPFAE